MSESTLTPGELEEAMRIRRIAFQLWEAFALQEACAHGVFDALSTAPAAPGALAARLQLHPRAMGAILEVLAAMRLLSVEGGVYRNTAAAEKFLVSSSSFNQAEIVKHYREVIDIPKMRRSLVAGWDAPASPTNAFEPARPSTLSAAQAEMLEAMHDTATVLAPAIVTAARLQGPLRLLDVGGGSGSYSIFLALANPALSAVVMDSGWVVKGLEDFTRRYGVDDRVSGRVADMHGADYGTGFDVVFCSNVMHINSSQQCAAIVENCFRALKPGGRILIHEPLRNGHGDGPLFPALFSMSLMIRSSEGNTYTITDLRDWLGQGGFTDIEEVSLSPLPTSLVSARVPHA